MAAAVAATDAHGGAEVRSGSKLADEQEISWFPVLAAALCTKRQVSTGEQLTRQRGRSLRICMA